MGGRTKDDEVEDCAVVEYNVESWYKLYATLHAVDIGDESFRIGLVFFGLRILEEDKAIASLNVDTIHRDGLVVGS